MLGVVVAGVVGVVGVTGVDGLLTVGVTSAGVVSVEVPEDPGCSLARIWSAWTMKFFQISAGKVPPSTGAPL